MPHFLNLRAQAMGTPRLADLLDRVVDRNDDTVSFLG